MGNLEPTLIFVLREIRLGGGCVNSTIALGTAYGILWYNNPFTFKKCGGVIQLNIPWAKKLLQRNNWVRKKATIGHRHIPADFELIKQNFLDKYNYFITTHNIPVHLVINFDQTGIRLVFVSNWILDERGADVVSITGKEDKRQITAVFAGTASGYFFPFQLIYAGKTAACHPKKKRVPERWDIHHSENHWSNVDTNCRSPHSHSHLWQVCV